MQTYIKGHFRKSIYQNEAGYIIGIFKVQETNDEEIEIYVGRTLTFTGYFHELNDLDTYIFYGKLVNHERYGEQFQVSSYERCKPEEKEAIVEFLTSGIFKGIGEKKAQKIVDVLGKDTLTIILEQPDNLLLIPTITKKNVDLLHSKLVEYEASYQTILKLTDLGFSTKESMMIYNFYKEKTLRVVEENVYRIRQDLLEITFKKVDMVSLALGIKRDDPRRIAAGILYTIEELTNQTGHCFFMFSEVKAYTIRCLGIPLEDDMIQESVEELVRDQFLYVEDDHYYLFAIYEAECNVVRRFQLLNREETKSITGMEKWIEALEKEHQIHYNEDQKNAILHAYSNPLTIITGGPGTGKTTIIQGIIELYRLEKHCSYSELQEEVVLLAPTGRASKRMSEATLMPAQTIHRFLKWNKETNKFAVNEHNKSDAKFVIIDEASMIDVVLLDHLLKGLSYRAKIVLVGDDHQLPSVGPGQVLRDLIESEAFDVCKLKELYRQKENSKILSLAYHIQEGVIVQEDFNVEPDLTFVECSKDFVQEELRTLCEAYQDVNLKDFQVLAPMYKSQNGIDALNKMLQSIFNPKDPSKKEIVVGDVIYREQDKVIQLTNMPDDNVYNGDLGFIQKIEDGSKRAIYIDFDGNLVKYTASSFQNFKHGFAISIHKAQGSEFDKVIMPIVQNYSKMLYQRLIYTGVTRAKKELYLLGQMEALKFAARNHENDYRRTTIQKMLNQGIEPNSFFHTKNGM